MDPPHSLPPLTEGALVDSTPAVPAENDPSMEFTPENSEKMEPAPNMHAQDGPVPVQAMAASPFEPVPGAESIPAEPMPVQFSSFEPAPFNPSDLAQNVAPAPVEPAVPFAPLEIGPFESVPLAAEVAPHAPFYSNLGNNVLGPPRAPYLASETSTPRDSYAHTTPGNSSPLLPASNKPEPDGFAAAEDSGRSSSKRHRYLLFSIPLIIIVIIIAVVVPIVVLKNHHNTNNNTSASGSPSQPNAPTHSGKPSPSSSTTTGGNGSTVTQEDGTTFTYINPFGGFCESISEL
jgi:hypothetical protein